MEGQSSELFDVPVGLTENYEKADFEKYNSPASENGLGGKLIWFEGTMGNTGSYGDGEGADSGYWAMITEDTGNSWYVMLDAVESTKQEVFSAMNGHRVCMFSLYLGYSEVYKAPSVAMICLFDRTDGKLLQSKAMDGYKAEPNRVKNERYEDNDTWMVIKQEMHVKSSGETVFIDKVIGKKDAIISATMYAKNSAGEVIGKSSNSIHLSAGNPDYFLFSFAKDISNAEITVEWKINTKPNYDGDINAIKVVSCEIDSRKQSEDKYSTDCILCIKQISDKIGAHASYKILVYNRNEFVAEKKGYVSMLPWKLEVGREVRNIKPIGNIRATQAECYIEP